MSGGRYQPQTKLPPQTRSILTQANQVELVIGDKYFKPHHVLSQFDKTYLLDSINNVNLHLVKANNLSLVQRESISNSLNTLAIIIQTLHHIDSGVSHGFKRLIMAFDDLVNPQELFNNSPGKLIRRDGSILEASVTRENVSGIFD